MRANVHKKAESAKLSAFFFCSLVYITLLPAPCLSVPRHQSRPRRCRYWCRQQVRRCHLTPSLSAPPRRWRPPRKFRKFLPCKRATRGRAIDDSFAVVHNQCLMNIFPTENFWNPLPSSTNLSKHLCLSVFREVEENFFSSTSLPPFFGCSQCKMYINLILNYLR